MSASYHSLFGRPALALGARVLDSRELQGGDQQWTFVVNVGGLEPADLDWLRSRRGACPLDSESDSLVLSLLATELDAQRTAIPLGQALAIARDAWSAPLETPQIMGILNATPDSFSDGGLHQDPQKAIEAGLRFLEEGATWLDVGGESTRPGAQPVPLQEETDRVLPILEGLAREGVTKLSVDTRHAAVARAALDAGATMVNDVGAGLDDDEMLSVVAKAGCDYVIMHRQGTPTEMQKAPQYGDVLGEVAHFLRERAAACLAAGIAGSALWIDPGIGFGKRLEDNLALLRRLGELRSLGLPLLLGPSRKSFIGHISGNQQEADWARLEARDHPLGRLGGTAAAITFCVAGGVKVLRVHDVAVMSEACAVAAAIQASPAAPIPLPC
ncbi:MAG: dihydropteroate synthase [Candidatus Paceibacteria bacterium]